ncbi:MAG: hypothetical protein ACLTUL_08990 [Blautia faecis]
MNKVMADKKAIMIFTLPCLIFFGLIAFYPVFQTVIMSFFDWDGLTTKTFTGLANYIKLFRTEYSGHLSAIAFWLQEF